MREKRGQAAMEFLMTYGWALLAIIIIGGLIWIYIGGRECGRVSTGFLGQNIALEDWVYYDNLTSSLSLGNRAPNDVWVLQIDNVNIVDTKIPKGGGPVTISSANQPSVTVAGSCYKETQISVKYNVTGGTEHTAIGKLSGTYEDGL